MRKKILTIACSAILACALLCGCGGTEAPAASEPQPSTPPSNSSSGSSESPASSLPSSNPSSVPSKDDSDSTASLQPKVESKSFRISRSGDYYYTYYCFTLVNPNKVKDFSFGKIEFTVKDADGRVIDTSTDYIPPIAAGDTITFGGEILTSGGVPASVTYTLDFPKHGSTLRNEKEVSKQSDLVVFNTSRIEKDSFISYTGEITNNSAVDMDSVMVRVFYTKDGVLYAGEDTYVSNLKPGQTKAFDILALDDFSGYDSYRVIAVQGS